MAMLIDRVDIRCPRCAARAAFVEPFEFLAAAPADRPAQRWGGWHVVERYPHLQPWQSPKRSSQQYLTTGRGERGGYALMRRGVVECRACLPFVHTLAWPDDAWWQWRIRGGLLWAHDRAHALQILAFVRATDRPPRPRSGPLGRVPGHFLTARIRSAVVAAIEKKLAAG